MTNSFLVIQCAVTCLLPSKKQMHSKYFLDISIYWTILDHADQKELLDSFIILYIVFKQSSATANGLSCPFK